MNIEKLIAEILVRECLWNQAHPDHHNRFVLEKKWEEVSSILGIARDGAKHKWKYLRDTFRKELAKCPKRKSGDEGGIVITSKWPYFKSLLFLKDQFTPRTSTSNLASTSSCANPMLLDTDSSEYVEEDDSLDSELAPTTVSAEIDEVQGFESQSHVDRDWASTPQSTSNEPSASSRKRKGSNDLIGQALLNVEKEKLRLLQQKEKAPIEKPLDEDRCFFESILPHVQKLDPLRKLQFRSKVQDLVMSYAYGHDSQPTSTPNINTPMADPNFNQYQW